MKKVIIKIFVIMLVVVFNIYNIYAANLNANLSVTEVEQGKSFKISVNSSSKLTDFEVAVNNSSLGTPTVVSKYTGSSESTSGTKKIVKMFQLAAQVEKKVVASGANLATFEYTVPSNLSAGSYNITVTLKAVTEAGGKLNESTTKTIKVVAPKSTNANLSSITIDGKTIEGFNKNTTIYTLPTVESNITSIKVAATLEDSKAKLSGTGTIKLKEGKNTITLKVTAESGATKTYTLTVNRKEEPKSTNANLSSITIAGKALSGFNKNTTKYTLDTVENNTTSLKIGATLEDGKAKLSGTGTIKLKEGKNTITLKVTAESGATKTYTLTVTRKEKEVIKSSDCSLKTIKVNGDEITNFNKGVFEYTLTNVSYGVDSLTLEAYVSDEKAIVEGIGKKELKVGKNQFTITVTAEDNTKQMYIVNVVREAEKVVIPTVNDNVETNNYTIYAVIGITAICVVIVITKFIADRRKNK